MPRSFVVAEQLRGLTAVYLDPTFPIITTPVVGEDQWPDGVIDFALTIDFSKLWNLT